MTSRRERANAIRILAIDAIEKAASGHPGAPLGMADMAEVLWGRFIVHNPANPSWPNRDRFILSNGHASMLLYAVLHLTGYNLPLAEIKRFRQWQSLTPGHPERNLKIGVEMTTGPLGQGIASAVGLALAEALLGATFNRPGYPVIDHYTYAFCGEGCLMEGISHEACSLAGTWRLGKLIVLFDANGVSIDGDVGGWYTEDVAGRFKAYGWQVMDAVDGHDFEALDAAIAAARAETTRPSLIVCKTHIGFGSPKRDSSASHGAPLGAEAARATREALGWQGEAFEIPPHIYESWDAREKGAAAEAKWRKLVEEYAAAYPELARELRLRLARELPADWEEIKARVLAQAEKEGRDLATRVASRDALQTLVAAIPSMLGGSADLSSSVGTITDASEPLDPLTHKGNYVYYGVREFGMGAIMNGLAMNGGFIPYAGTFLAFSDQAKNALRLSALMGLRVIWVMTHDSIGVGEDGPTHQPVEQLPALRLIPNMHVWRPCDSLETAQAWISALESERAPTCLVLSRQKLPQMEHAPEQVAEIARGGYILYEPVGQVRIILMASGSEVALALAAAKELGARSIGARVVSMPCLEIFESQDQAWKDRVLPPAIRTRLAIEAASADWWIPYVGLDGGIIGMKGFGSSGPGPELFKKFGFTVANVVKTAEDLLAKK